MRGPDSISRRLLLSLAALAACIWLADRGGEPLRERFALETGAVLSGEVWRLATAHVVHLSHDHALLNIAGLGLAAATLWPALTAGGLLRACAVSAGCIGLGWLLAAPAGPTYSGFSGITHGLFAYGGLAMLRAGPAWFGWVVLAHLAAKLGWEALGGPLPGAGEAIGGRVNLMVHSLGALGGALAAPGPRRWQAAAVLAIALTLPLQIARERAQDAPAQDATHDLR